MQAKLTKRAVDAINPSDRDLLVWDTEMPGFGLRCRISGSKWYIIKFRAAGRQRWFTIGRHGALTPARQGMAREPAYRENFRMTPDSPTAQPMSAPTNATALRDTVTPLACGSHSTPPSFE